MTSRIRKDLGPAFRKPLFLGWSKALNVKETGTIHIPPVPFIKATKDTQSSKSLKKEFALAGILPFHLERAR